MIGRYSPSTEVTITQLESYLRHKQWYRDGDVRNIATIWHRHQDQAAEVILPLPTARDFRQRLRDAIEAIASYEKRESFNLLRDIERQFSDVVTVRVVHADTQDGNIPISDGVLLITKAKDLLTAAAQSVFSKRRHYTGKVPSEANDYLATLLLGQTEVGSYVVNVIAPIHENAVLAPSTAEAVPLAQAVTRNLLTGLQALTKANEVYAERGDITVFDEAVLSGVSANLCDALLGFSGIRNNRAFEVTVTAAPSSLFGSESKNFEFGVSQIEWLKKASSYYKDDYVLRERRLTGHIIRLSRPLYEVVGTIIIETTVNDIARKVKVELTGDDYHMAVLAHDGGKPVRVEGDVWIKAKTAELLNPYNFGVITTGDLF